MYTNFSGDTKERTIRSSKRAFIDQAFGKDWFFDLFLCFGPIDDEMVEMVHKECTRRKQEQTGDDGATLSRAPSQGCENLERLSKRNQSLKRGEELPKVQGVSHRESTCKVERGKAKALQLEYKRKQAWWNWEEKEYMAYRLYATDRTVTKADVNLARQAAQDSGDCWTQMTVGECPLDELQIAPSISAGEFLISYFEMVFFLLGAFEAQAYKYMNRCIDIYPCKSIHLGFLVCYCCFLSVGEHTCIIHIGIDAPVRIHICIYAHTHIDVNDANTYTCPASSRVECSFKTHIHILKYIHAPSIFAGDMQIQDTQTHR